MGKFNREGRTSGARFSNRDFNDRRSDRTMYSAVCDNCGKDCQVPFKPSSDKPVYCSDCFKKKREPQRSDFPRRETPSFSRDQLDSLNSKLDKILSLLENTPPKQEKPTPEASGPKKEKKAKSSQKKTTSKKKSSKS